MFKLEKTKKTEKQPKEKVVKRITGDVNVNKFVGESIKEIRDRANLGDYNISYRFANKDRSMHGGIVFADINVDGVYMNAYVTVYPSLVELIRRGEKEEAMRVLCHEVMHIRTDKISKLAMNRFSGKTAIMEEIEKLTEYCARSVYKNMTNVEEANGHSNTVKPVQKADNTSRKVPNITI